MSLSAVPISTVRSDRAPESGRRPAIHFVELSGDRGLQEAGARDRPGFVDLEGMDVLCTDKTGTLTEGLMVLEGPYDAWGSSAITALYVVATEITKHRFYRGVA